MPSPRLPERARVSIAMCTCEGERHLEQQLSSLVAQSRPPDELVVLDDRSTDRTVEILERFAERSPFRVRIGVNDARLGWVRNFEKVTWLPEGDVIFFADQDDVWHPQKIERFVEALRAAPGAGFAFSDAELVDEQLEPLGLGLWQALNFGEAERRSMDADGGVDLVVKQLRHVVAPGMTLAFLAPFRELILPFPPGWWHDGLIPLALIAVGAGPVMIPERLASWRQHSRQLTGLRAFRAVEQLKRPTVRGRNHEYQVMRGRGLLERLHEKASLFPPDPRVLRILTERTEHAEARLEARTRWWKLAPVLRELRTGNYHKYSRGWWSVAKDLLP